MELKPWLIRRSKSFQTYCELKSFADYFIKYGKPLSQKREALAIFQATTQAGFSNVVELETSTVTEDLLKEAIDDYKGDYYIAYNKLGSFFIRFKDDIFEPPILSPTNGKQIFNPIRFF